MCQNFLLTHGPLQAANACELLLAADAYRAPRLREAALDAYAADPEAAAAGPGLDALPKRLLRECLRTTPARKRRREEAVAAGWPEEDLCGSAARGRGGDVGEGIATAMDLLKQFEEDLARIGQSGWDGSIGSPPPRGPPARPSL